MKKYKLIKEYPESPKLNEMIQEPLYITSNGLMIAGIALERGDYSEFWKEVVEKDYEILSFISTDKAVGEKPNIIRYPGKEGYTVDDYLYNGESVKNGAYLIHSIKRLSDGEIFTIGDKVQDSLTDELTNFKVQTINYFYFGDKIICQAESRTTMPLNTIRKAKTPLFTTEDGVEAIENITKVCWVEYRDNKWITSRGVTSYYQQSVDSGNWKAFKEIEAREKWLNDKYPKPLFITEDIVNIFEGDKFYYVSSNFKVYNKIATNDYVKLRIYKDFSTKEKAEEYILMNKKSLSPNDILKVWSKLSGHSVDSLMKNSTLMATIITHLKNENNKK